MTSLLARRAPGLPGAAVEVGVVLLAVLASLAVRLLTLDELDVALAHAHSLLSLEQSRGLAWEHAAQGPVERVPWLATYASWFYVWGYLPVVALALVVLFVRWPHDYAFLRNALLAGGIVGLPVYVLWPLAPPRLTDLGYTDTVARSVVDGVARPVGVANEIAAMPSFHVAYLVVVSAVAWRVSRSVLLRAWCVLHPVMMCWVVLATGNHWVLDLPAGVVLAVVALAVAGWIESRAASGSDARFPGPNGPVRSSAGGPSVDAEGRSTWLIARTPRTTPATPSTAWACSGPGSTSGCRPTASGSTSWRSSRASSGRPSRSSTASTRWAPSLAA